MATANTDGPLHDLTGFQRDALALIADLGAPCGLDLKRALEDTYGVREINHGKLYPNLDELADRSLVEKTTADGRTNNYQITARGRRELAAHVNWHTKMLNQTND